MVAITPITNYPQTIALNDGKRLNLVRDLSIPGVRKINDRINLLMGSGEIWVELNGRADKAFNFREFMTERTDFVLVDKIIKAAYHLKEGE